MRIKSSCNPNWRDEWHGKFLWLPRRIDGQIVWLEYVWRRGRHRYPADYYYEYALQVPKEI